MPGFKNPTFAPLLITGFTGIILLFILFLKNQMVSAESPRVQKQQQQISTQTVSPNLPDKAIDSLKKADPETGGGPNTYTGMSPFFEALGHVISDNTTLHIAYFGDSMIEGDLVTHPLRRRLQKRFGGNGIGFIPITSPQPGFRSTIFQKFNDDWKVWSFVKPGFQPDVFPGLSGYVFETTEGAETSFRSEKNYGPFSRATILYGGRNTIRLSVVTDTLKNEISLTPTGTVNSFTLARDSIFSSVSLKVTSSEPGIMYGMNFENGRGVYVDNYAFRGNSGLPLKKIPASVFRGFHTALNDKLIIIHYGLNVFTPGVEDYNWYEQAMCNVIRHVKEMSPGIPVLMISMPDRAALISGEYATPAELPDFIRLQKRVAENEQVAFFSLFDAMGGVGSMRNWVEGKTKLAGDDYTHPNGSGASRIAELIYQFLIDGYEKSEQQTDSVASTLHAKAS